MTIQILHTADNHLDPIASTFGLKRLERRMDHLRCFEEVLDYAIKNRPDILTISGDLFDTTRPGNIVRAEVMEGFKALNEAGVRICLIGGHHDTPKSVEEGSSPLSIYGRSGYATFFEDPSNPAVSCFERSGLKVCVTGVGFNPLLSWDRDPLAGLKLDAQGDVNILLTHYPIEGFEGYYGSEPLIKIYSIPEGYQLIAAGHLHKHQEKKIGNIDIIYPGSTERASFLEEDEEKGFTWLEVGRGGLISAEFIKTSSRPLKTLRFDVSRYDDITEALKVELVRDSDRKLIFRVKLTGSIRIEQLARYRRSELLSYGSEHYFHLMIDEDELNITTPEPIEALPRTTPLIELRRYFEKILLEASGDERAEFEEALKLSESKLEEAGAW